MASGKTSLNNLIDSKILSGGRRTTANNHREVEKEIVSSSLNIVDGGLVVQSLTGYASVLIPTDDKHFTPKKYVNDQDAATLVSANLYADSLDSNVVHLTGAETIAGIKTFSSIPVLPASDPTTDNQAARKAYVDSEIAAVTLTAGPGTVITDGAIGLDLAGYFTSGGINLSSSEGMSLTPLSGGLTVNAATEINGDLNMGSNDITSVGDVVFNASGTGFKDQNSVQLVKFNGVTSADKYFILSNALSSNGPILSVEDGAGGDVNLTIQASGAGIVRMASHLDMTAKNITDVGSIELENGGTIVNEAGTITETFAADGSHTVSGANIYKLVDDGYGKGWEEITQTYSALGFGANQIYVSDTVTQITTTGNVEITGAGLTSTTETTTLNASTSITLDSPVIDLVGVVSIKDNTDNTKVKVDDISGFTTATTRTATWQDKSGTVAYINNETFTGTTNLATAVVSTSLTVASDTDATTILGRAKISSPTTDVMFLSHFDRDNATDFALSQNSSGAVVLNSTAGQSVSIALGGTTVASFSASGNLTTRSILTDSSTRQIGASGTRFGTAFLTSINCLTSFGLGVTPATAQTGAVQTAGAAYGATEQDMLQKAYNALRTFGFLS